MINALMHCCRAALLCGLALLGALVPVTASAHKASDAYVQVRTSDAGLELRLDVALRDLDLVIDIDANVDGRISWGEVKSAWPLIDAYVLGRLAVQGCELRPGARGLEQRSDGVYAVLVMTSPCRLQQEPSITYRLLSEVDSTHRGIARIEIAGRPLMLRVLDPTAATPDLRGTGTVRGASGHGPGGTAVQAAPTLAAGFLAVGIHHIVTGYDHLLFLLCLLLPCVMRRTAQGWQPVQGLRQAVLPVAGIVTAFTLAHSITLALATLRWVSLPAAIIEPAIALTIVLAAIDNLRPIFGARRGWVTFLFGLVHGFGFAGVLGELNLAAGQFAYALLQFNLGLELGQLAIVVLGTGLL
ncbi:MAG: HupE/UreJ family protein, partial [Betaproteobacteria bacterium]|nr:HupE/UreJ family protein [Betaproteobacteria bacterium]